MASVTSLPVERPALSGRGEIRLGFRCNARCGFCYYQGLLDQPMELEPSMEELLGQLQALRRLGATEVEFTGGEPTIRAELPELVARAKALGFVHISLITNGIQLARESYAQKLVDAGVNDVLFSIHGADASCHDAHTAVPGSFVKVTRAFANLRALGARCRTTCTVTGRNVDQLGRIVELSQTLGADCIHFAVFSPVARAGDSAADLWVSYEAAAQALRSAILPVADSLPPVSIKYIPFCYLPGLERYVMNLYQQSFDPDDWNYYYSNRVRRAPAGLRGFLFDLLAYSGCLLAPNWRVLKAYGRRGLKIYGFTRLVELLRKRRLPACRDCRFDRVCDHVWREQPAERMPGPLTGPPVHHPAETYAMAWTRSPGSVTVRAPARELRLVDVTADG